MNETFLKFCPLALKAKEGQKKARSQESLKLMETEAETLYIIQQQTNFS